MGSYWPNPIRATGYLQGAGHLLFTGCTVSASQGASQFNRKGSDPDKPEGRQRRLYMKAIILAAGLGSRLRPLTDNTPKALIEVGGKPLLLHAAEKLIAAGVSDIVVNIHHHGNMIQEFIEQLEYPGVKFHISDETDELLDTGGALKKAAPLLQGTAPFFIYNADILAGINLKEMLAKHQQEKPLATLAVTCRQSSRYFLWKDGQLAGWTKHSTANPGSATFDGMEKLAFSGIHLADPSLLRLITETGRFSIKDLYLRLAPHHRIIPYLHDHRFWADTGTPEKLKQAEDMLQHMPPP